jgi:hypothetical protein
MACGDITINGSPLGLGTVITGWVAPGDRNSLEFSGSGSAEYTINGSVAVRGALTRGEIFNINHWFRHQDVGQIQAMEMVAYTSVE